MSGSTASYDDSTNSEDFNSMWDGNNMIDIPDFSDTSNNALKKIFEKKQKKYVYNYRSLNRCSIIYK